jgi:molybdate transport system regulatory protein
METEAISPLKLKANGRIWIDTEKGPYLGYGRIELLEKVKQFGSIRQAALDMKMSYRQAWELIDQMNQQAETPLILTQRGGKGGGQAVLTETGEAAIVLFHSFNKAFQEFLQAYTERLNR